ncbi:ganglioside GM2 activator-like [Ylistrum balloti]|uniref:ganglioside GM2 activator-like n=1 Tax=Ylistrum balloti TaxID=509963 RepID=UPI002905E19A|nr:ganglioside GM2 activator-like [Ylistrum balloti]
MTSVFAVLLVMHGLFVSVQGSGFTWSSCNSNPVIVMETIVVTPDPVELPGTLKLTLRGNTTRPINSAKLSITLHRDTFLLSVPIPCLLHLGSCEYTDLCTLLDTMISENWATITTDLGTQVKTMLSSAGISFNPGLCPLPVSQLDLNKYPLNLPSVPSVLSWLASGDYTIKVEVVDSTNNENLMCLNLGITLTKASECTGWLCGRRKRDILKNKN